jgi:hypothetical protein
LGYLSKDAIYNKVVEPHNIFSLIYTQILSISPVVHLDHNLLAGFVVSTEAFAFTSVNVCSRNGKTEQRPVLLLEVSTPQEPELHLDMSALQRHVLLLEVSTPQEP